jgi:hypothetical protein
MFDSIAVWQRGFAPSNKERSHASKIKNLPFSREASRGGTATTTFTFVVDPESTSGWCRSKQAAPDCSSGG